MNRVDATKQQNVYRTKLNCPLCGSPRTHYKQRTMSMICEKCGNEYRRPE